MTRPSNAREFDIIVFGATSFVGADPLVVDTLEPAFLWGSEVSFHHATQDLHRAVQA